MRRVALVLLGIVAAAALACVPRSAVASGAPITFVPQSQFVVGPLPYSLAAGDLNGDGFTDLVVANFSGSSVSVLLGDGAGAFHATGLIGVGSGPYSIALGDVNGDHALDIATANELVTTASVMLGHGDATFADAVSYATGSTPLAVALADIDRDGKLDLVVVNEHANSVTVRLGNGDGTFGGQSGYGTDTDPIALAIGDLNADGWPDLVVANVSSASVSVLLGSAGGSFQMRSDYSVGATPYSVAIGDLDGDGKPDLAVACAGSGVVSLLMGTGGGAFGPAQSVAVGNGPQAVAIADLDRDGVPDIITANFGAANVSVLVGLGGGAFGAAVNFDVAQRPTALVAADLNGDGTTDLAVTNAGSNSVSVLLNSTQVNAPHTATQFVSDPNPSLFGQPVLLTATVTPDPATGSVEFSDGGTVIGYGALAAGRATLSADSLLGGRHHLRARFMGVPGFIGSMSPELLQVVTLTPTVSTLASSANPAVHALAVNFVATVATSPAGAAVTSGTVRFRIDGADFGGPVRVFAGRAVSLFTDTLAVGTHDVVAMYQPADSLRYAGDSSAVLRQVITSSNPVIVAVRDVPHDQGGHVFVQWHCALDQAGIRVVTGYRVWRRVPPQGANAAAAVCRRFRAGAADSAVAETFWEALAELPAAQLVSYGYTAATTQDSIAGSNPATAFFVQALTADANLWFDSDPDSGYSVDNLSPPAPTPFVAQYTPQGVALHWAGSRAPDVALYRLHRGPTADFVPGPGNLLSAQADTGYVDAGSSGQYCYKLAAVDVHGNVGRWAIIEPAGATATLATFLAPAIEGGHVRLRWYVSTDDALTLTVYRRSVTEGWQSLGAVLPDGQGYAAYEDDGLVSGARYGYRLGMRSAAAAETYAGEGWVDVPMTVSDLAVRVPNPVRDGGVTVSFAAPAGRAVRVELFDLAGRAVASRVVQGGLGRQTVDLARSAELAPGLYLVRVGLGRPVTMRVAVMR